MPGVFKEKIEFPTGTMERSEGLSVIVIRAVDYLGITRIGNGDRIIFLTKPYL